jgi:hypothetical protein
MAVPPALCAVADKPFRANSFDCRGGPWLQFACPYTDGSRHACGNRGTQSLLDDAWLARDIGIDFGAPWPTPAFTPRVQNQATHCQTSSKSARPSQLSL